MAWVAQLRREVNAVVERSSPRRGAAAASSRHHVTPPRLGYELPADLEEAGRAGAFEMSGSDGVQVAARWLSEHT